MSVDEIVRVWVPEDTSRWRVLSERDIRRCRYGLGSKRCTNKACAALNRGRKTKWAGRTDSWWAYCSEHLYGRRIRNGIVEHQVCQEAAERMGFPGTSPTV